MERNPELLKTFKEFLAKYGNSKVVIATHSRADVDSISSAFALSKVLPNSVISVTEEMREGAQMLSEKLGIDVVDLKKLNKNDFEGLVSVDTSTYVLLPDAKGWNILCVIDHHQAEGRDMKGEFEILDSSSPSTAEIMFGILPEIDKDASFGLSVGIIADAARFKSARKETFEILSKLMGKADADYSELLDYAEPEPRQEAKIAMLTAMKRLNYVYAADYIIATSEVGSNESDAASIIAEAADVAFVASWRDQEQETRISARARKSVRVPLNKVLSKAGEELGGAGGGHPKAAGAALKAHTQEALEKCIEIFINMAQ